MLLSLLVVQLGCSCLPTVVNPPIYHPENFRADIDSLIDKKQYSAAVAYLKSADPKRQADHDKQGYLAVGEVGIAIPGVEEKQRYLVYDPSRDWCFPGTQDAIEDEAWQKAATRFAEQYNVARGGK